MADEREQLPTAITVVPDYECGLVIAELPIDVDGETLTIEVSLSPELARELAYTLTVTSMNVEEYQLPE